MSLGTGIATVQYSSSETEGLSLEKGDIVSILLAEGEKFYAVIGGKVGYVPKQHIRLLSLGKCQVIETHVEGVKEGQLMLVQGDVIDILLKETERWYGRIQTTEGWFIPDFVREISKTTTESYSTPKLEPVLGSDSTGYKIEDTSTNKLNLPSDDFDSVTHQASVLVDLRRNRARKPLGRPVSKEHMLDMLSDSNEHTDNLSENLIDLDDVDGSKEASDEQRKPKKINQSDPPWLSELKNKYPVGKETNLRKVSTPNNNLDKEPLVELRKKMPEPAVLAKRNSRVEETTSKYLINNLDVSEKNVSKKPLQVKSMNFADIRKRFNSGGDNLAKEVVQRANISPNNISKQFDKDSVAKEDLNIKRPSFPLKTTKSIEITSSSKDDTLMQENIDLSISPENPSRSKIADPKSVVKQSSDNFKENTSNSNIMVAKQSPNVDATDKGKLATDSGLENKGNVSLKTGSTNNTKNDNNVFIEKYSFAADFANKREPVTINSTEPDYEIPANRAANIAKTSTDTPLLNNDLRNDNNVFIRKYPFVADVVDKQESDTVNSTKPNNETPSANTVKDNMSTKTNPSKVDVELNLCTSSRIAENTSNVKINVFSKQNKIANQSSDVDIETKAALEARITALEKIVEQCQKKIEKLSREVLSLKVSSFDYQNS